MYASSIFGWLRFVEARSASLRAESPVSTSPLAEPLTEASRAGLLELCELVDPLTRSTVVADERSSHDARAMETVLERLYADGVVRRGDLPSTTADRVERSDRFHVLDGYVLVPILEERSNLLPVLTRVTDTIEEIVGIVTDILKFLGADESSEAPWLSTRWRQVGGLLSDLYSAFRHLVRQRRRRDRMNETKETYTDWTQRMSKDRIGYTND